MDWGPLKSSKEASRYKKKGSDQSEPFFYKMHIKFFILIRFIKNQRNKVWSIRKCAVDCGQSAVDDFTCTWQPAQELPQISG
jgi:hypothetical protein